MGPIHHQMYMVIALKLSTGGDPMTCDDFFQIHYLDPILNSENRTDICFRFSIYVGATYE